MTLMAVLVVAAAVGLLAGDLKPSEVVGKVRKVTATANLLQAKEPSREGLSVHIRPHFFPYKESNRFVIHRLLGLHNTT